MTLLDFYAPWCGPCKTMSPIIDEIKLEYPNLKIEKINVDEAPDIAEKYNIMSVPTLVLIRDDEAHVKKTGVMTKEQLRNFIDNSI